MAYQYDIFISYKRNPETLNWINRHLIPLLQLHVGFDLPEELSFCIDTQLEAGTTWPADLARRLASSRIIMPLWTRNYFNSVWCTAELSHMLKREETTGCRTLTNPNGVIVPVVIHDGETFPDSLSYIQKFEIQKSFSARMRKYSVLSEFLEGQIKDNASAIYNAISNAPEWRQDWHDLAARDFYDLYYRGIGQSQNQLPKYSAT